MSERYSKIFALQENLYAEDSPVIIKAGALLKDNESGRLIAQLKFCNISDKKIKLIKVKITCIDSVGRSLGDPFLYEYLDINALREEEFGSKKPIIIPNGSTRSFLASVVEVGYADASLWNSDCEWFSLPYQTPISALITDGYAMSAYKNAFGNTAQFAIAEHMDLWLCTCGAYNRNGEELCHKCHASHSSLKSVDVEALKIEGMYAVSHKLYSAGDAKSLEKAIALFETIPEYKDAAELKDKCKEKLNVLRSKQIENARKRNKIIKISSVICVAAIILASLAYFVAYPFIAQANGDYQVIIDMYNIENYEIPEGTTEIKDNAFNGNKTIKSVTIPDSVTAIGKQAFGGCESLRSITIPAGVTEIGDEAFNWCHQLNRITVDENNAYYKSIDGNLYTKDGKTLIQYALGKPDDTFVSPDGVTTIGDCAFWGARNLKNVTVGGSVTDINRFAFTWCENLETVTISNSVKNIGISAFSNCQKLKKVYIGKNVESIHEEAFGYLTDATIYYAGSKAEWDNIKPSYSPYSVSVEYNQCIEHSLTKISAKTPGCTEIGYNEYWKCDFCEYSTREEISALGHNYVDLYCSRCGEPKASEGLKYLYNKATNSYRAIGNGTCTDKTIVIPATYQGLPVTGVGDMTQGGFGPYVETIIISEGITSIDFYAFAHNEDNLKTVYIPSSVTSIGYFTFYSCPKLESVIFSENSKCTAISNAFNDCDKLQITIPAGVTQIENSFSNVKRIDVSEENPSYQSIEGNLYTKDGTTLLLCSRGSTTINISLSVTKITDSLQGILNVYYEGSECKWKTIEGVSAISSDTVVHFGNQGDQHTLERHTSQTASCSNIGWDEYFTCKNCDYSTYVEIEQLDHDYNELYKCKTCQFQYYSEGLEYYCYTDSYGRKACAVWGNGTCTDTVIVIPPTYNGYPVTEVGGYMGGGFGQYVEKMIIPEGVTTIPYYGLGWTPNLKSLILPKTFSSLGGPAFYSCNNLTDIYYAGSQAMWNQIYIAPEMDDEVWFNATIHYNYIPEE